MPEVPLDFEVPEVYQRYLKDKRLQRHLRHH